MDYIPDAIIKKGGICMSIVQESQFYCPQCKHLCKAEAWGSINIQSNSDVLILIMRQNSFKVRFRPYKVILQHL